VISAAIAGIFAGGMMLQEQHLAKEMVKCMGANSCKGKSHVKSQRATATHVQARMVARAKECAVEKNIARRPIIARVKVFV